MRRHHRKKVHHVFPQKLPVKHKGSFKGVDNTQDIDLILSNAKLCQDLLGLTNHRIGRLYETALGLLDQQRYDEAAKSFELLTRLNPYVADFWMGLGIAYQLQEKNKEALSQFLVAQTMDPTRSEPYIMAIDCCIALQDRAQASVIYNEALLHAKREWQTEEGQLLLHELELRRDSISG